MKDRGDEPALLGTDHARGSAEGSITGNGDSDSFAVASSLAASNTPGIGRPFEFQGGEPRNSLFSRSVDVDRRSWDAFLGKSKGRRNSGIFTAFLQPRDENEIVCNAPPKEDRHRSIFGLPVLSPYNHMAASWSLFILILDMTYSAFILPIIVAFVYNDPDDESVVWATVVEILSGIFFLIDFVMNFHIGFIIVHDYKKKVVMDGASIKWYYWNYGGALIDGIAALPVFLEIGFAAADNCRQGVLAYVRMVRLLRLVRLLTRMYEGVFTGSMKNPVLIAIRRRTNNAVPRLVNVLFAGGVLTNFMACLLFYVASIQGLNDSWVAKGGPVCEDGVEDCGGYVADSARTRQYLASMYWAITTMTTVGYGDIHPTTAAEEVVVMILMITHIMLFGLLIGAISELMKTASKHARNADAFTEKMDAVTGWLKERHVPSKLQQRVFAYYAEIWARRSQDHEAELIKDLPYYVRSEVLCNITRNLVAELRVFRDVDEESQHCIIAHLKPVSIPPGHELFAQGDAAESLFIVEEGVLVMLVDEKEVARIHGPTTCGESAILAKDMPEYSVRKVTLRARKACHLWEIEIRDLQPLFMSYPTLKDDLIEGYRLRVLQGKSRGLHAELGIDAVEDTNNLKSQLERCNTHDGTFHKLLQSTFKTMKKLGTKVHKSRPATIQELPLSDSFSTNNNESSHFPQPGDLAQKGLELIRLRVKQQGAHGLVAFHQKLERLAVGGEPKLSLASMQSALVDFDITCREVMALFMHIDEADTGAIFLRALSDRISAPGGTAERKALVDAVFNALDFDKKGHIDIMHLVVSFQTDKHPDVVLHKKTRGQVLAEFLAAFEGQESIFPHDFWTYHRMVSICMEGNSAFHALLCGVWGVDV